MDVGLLKFYEEGTSLRGNSSLLQQVDPSLGSWSTGIQGQSDLWYHPMEEDVYFITGLSRRGEDWPQFPDLPPGVAGETQLAYVQRYVIRHSFLFGIPGSWWSMWICSFHREEVRCLCLIIWTLSHTSSDGKHISFSLLHYVDSLVQRP
jgi:hypothetical protein